MQLSLILHLCPLPVWQYMLKATQPSTHQCAVPIRHSRPRTPAHRFLKRTTKYLRTHKKHRAPPTQTLTFLQHQLPVLPYAKPSTPINSDQSNPPNQLATHSLGSFLNKTHIQKPAASCHTLSTILPPLNFPPPPSQYTTLQLPNPMQCLTCS